MNRRLSKISKSLKESNDGEFLWLISLSDLMMLLFVFFVVMFSFAWKKLGTDDFRKIRDSFVADGQISADPVDEVQASLLKWVTDKKLIDSVSIVKKQDALILEIKEKLLFSLSDSKISSSGLEMIPSLREALLNIPGPYRIGIEGHTDDNPTGNNTSNWQLSVDRALSVHQALALPAELDSRTTIMGFGPYRPLKPNRDEHGKPIPENQAQNRRVTIRVF